MRKSEKYLMNLSNKLGMQSKILDNKVEILTGIDTIDNSSKRKLRVINWCNTLARLNSKNTYVRTIITEVSLLDIKKLLSVTISKDNVTISDLETDTVIINETLENTLNKLEISVDSFDICNETCITVPDIWYLFFSRGSKANEEQISSYRE